VLHKRYSSALKIWLKAHAETAVKQKNGKTSRTKVSVKISVTSQKGKFAVYRKNQPQQK
jgi:hypothetical protein